MTGGGVVSWRRGINGAEQAQAYVHAQYAATGMVPTQKRLLFERFFDESGGMQLVIHAPFGTRINRAWGLALRKRFCRSFDFELQASADDNGIVLSLGEQHSFPLEEMFKLVPSRLARDVLVQAFLAIPFFTTRWRWNVTRALQLKRARKGQRVPPHLQRMRADDLLTSVFPAQTACQENVVGDIEVPDQPLVRQTVKDCLHEAADLNGLMRVLRGIETGGIHLIALDSREPSPFAHELLNANPYAFLDDAPLEERRARAVTMRRSLSADALRDLGQLEPDAVAQVTSEAWPLVRDANELHDVLLSQGVLPIVNGAPWKEYFEQLRSTGRAVEMDEPSAPPVWAATERWPLAQAVWPLAKPKPDVAVPAGVRPAWPREEALAHIVRGRLECVGPMTVTSLAQTFALDPLDVEIALASLESQGIILRGRFTTPPVSRPSQGGEKHQSGSGPLAASHDLQGGVEWCDRRLLARIHRLTLEGLRRQIAPVPPEQFVRFLVRYQHAEPETRVRGQVGLITVLEQLEGFEAPVGHWEKYLLSTRLESYSSGWLDGLTFFGQAAWGRIRLRPTQAENGTPQEVNGSPIPAGNGRPMKPLTRSTPITLMLRDHLPWLLPPQERDEIENSQPALAVRTPPLTAHHLGSNARAAYAVFLQHGALFPAQLGSLLQLMPSQVDEVLGELAAAGLVTSDGYPALRSLLGVNRREAGRRKRALDFAAARKPPKHASAGRWTLLRSALLPAVAVEERTEHWCRLLLKRYGVMFRDLLANESTAPPWHMLVRSYRRMEARGEIRGGRFVAGVAGEQYALPEIIPALRAAGADTRKQPIILPATDPLNLSGRLVAGPRVPALPGHFISIADGKIDAVQRRLASAVLYS